MRAANVTVHLEESFSGWNIQRQEWLIERLALLAACDVSEIVVLGVKPGCVLIYLRMSDASAVRLAGEFNRAKAALDNGDDFPADSLVMIFKDIVSHFEVVSVRADVPNISTAVASSDAIEPPLFVLVHGWRGDETSFGCLPEILRDEFDAEVLVHQYTSKVLKSSDPLYFLGAQLSNVVNNRTYRSPRSVALIGHSMGGVVCRASIIESLLDTDKIEHYARFLKLFVSVASPLGGAWLGNVARLIPKGSGAIAQAAELSTNSQSLAFINAQWGSFVRKNPTIQRSLRSIYSVSDEIVPVNSAIGGDPNPICLAGLSHADIVKPSGPGDEFVRTIIRLAHVSGLRT